MNIYGLLGKKILVFSALSYLICSPTYGMEDLPPYQDIEKGMCRTSLSWSEEEPNDDEIFRLGAQALFDSLKPSSAAIQQEAGPPHDTTAPRPTSHTPKRRIHALQCETSPVKKRKPGRQTSSDRGQQQQKRVHKLHTYEAESPTQTTKGTRQTVKSPRPQRQSPIVIHDEAKRPKTKRVIPGCSVIKSHTTRHFFRRGHF